MSVKKSHSPPKAVGYPIRPNWRLIRKHAKELEKLGPPELMEIFKDKDTGILMQRFRYRNGYESVTCAETWGRAIGKRRSILTRKDK